MEPQMNPPPSWAYARYGESIVVGKCLLHLSDGGMLLSFRWGHPWRRPFVLRSEEILGPAEDPRLLSRLAQRARRQGRAALLRRPNPTAP
jgi:hypothetical protein